ncbi:MAG TPA: hypothetical protein VFZ21_28680 [Gemmatimonadaceae bacterium]|jgi:hypothetical protein|nr:hypothetical protein [Gemmatimonadaceae bacterium]
MPSTPAVPTRSKRPRSSLLIVVALALTLASPTRAQIVSERGNPQEMIPRDLVVALLSFGQPGNVDIRVGKVPEDIPPEFIPPGADLIGSMSQFENVVVVLGVSEPPDSAVGVMATRLVSSGWTKPPSIAARMPMRAGFVSADFAGAGTDGLPSYLCRGEAMVNLSAMYRMSGGSLLKVNYSRSSRNPVCREQQGERAFRSPYDDAPIPTLRAPAGTMMTGGSGMSSSSDGVSMHARVSGRLKPVDLVAHYDTQMKAAGWTPLADGAVEFLAARRYQKLDDRKRTWFGTLYAIVTPQANEHEVALHLTRR